MNKRVIVLDDDSDFLCCVTMLIETAGWTVIPFQEMPAPEVLLEFEADCILIDEMLPTICGHTLCMILKRIITSRKPLPIILMSGIEDLPARAKLAEADAFVQQPFSSNVDFIGLLSRIMNLSTGIA